MVRQLVRIVALPRLEIAGGLVVNMLQLGHGNNESRHETGLVARAVGEVFLFSRHGRSGPCRGGAGSTYLVTAATCRDRDELGNDPYARFAAPKLEQPRQLLPMRRAACSLAGEIANNGADPDTLVDLCGGARPQAVEHRGTRSTPVVQRYDLPVVVEHWRAGRTRLGVGEIVQHVVEARD